VQTLFAWAHLSDIQLGHGDAEHGYDQKLVLAALRKDLAGAGARGCPEIDAIVVTGDVAFRGAVAEYAEAKAWLAEIGEGRAIFVVPGNHDVDRGADADRDVARLVKDLRRDGALDEALAYEKDRAKLAKRMEPFLAFARDLGRGGGDLFWVHRQDARDGLRVRLVGLNTALLSADGGDKGKLRLGTAQIAKALDGVEPNELVIVLSHHPFRGGWLADEREADRWISNGAHLHLFGAVKDGESHEARSGAGGQFVRIAGRAAHKNKGEPADHGYSIAAIVQAEDGSFAVRIWPRCWSDKNKDFRSDVGNAPDGQAYAEHPLRLRLPRPAPPKQASSSPSVRAAAFEGPGGFPIDKVPHFLGRDAEMAELRAALVHDEAVCVVATGLGGIGKTSLVRQFVATEAAALFPDGSVWIDAMNLDADAARVAERFGYRGERRPTVTEAAAFLARVLHDMRVLVVIDNVDPERIDVTALPVAGGKSRTLLTSRAVTLHESLGRPAQPLMLGRWSPEACRAYLRDVAKEHKSAPDADLDALATFVDRLPLAVRLVAKLLLRKGETPIRLLERLKHEPLGILDKVAKGADRSVAATFKAAYEALDEMPRRVLLALAACARVTGAGAIAIAAGSAAEEDSEPKSTRSLTIAEMAEMREDAVSEALADLADRSLVELVDVEAQLWTLHDVVRLFVRAQEGIERADAAHLVFTWEYVRIHQDPADWEAMEAGMGEVLTAVDRLLNARDAEGAASLLGNASAHLMQRGRYGELVERYEQLAARLPESSNALAVVLGQLGLCYRTLGDVPKAVDHHRRSLALFEKLGDLAGQASQLGKIGLCCRRLGDVPKAIEHHQHALTIHEKLGRLEGQAAEFGNLGLCYWEGDIPKAIEHHQRALALHEKLGRLGSQAIQLGNLGCCYWGQGDALKAIEHYQRSLAINEKLGSLEGQARDLANLALCHEAQGDLSRALDHIESSLTLYRRMGFPEAHPNIRGRFAHVARIRAALASRPA
jgi:tetratricopeptide (TPR) repeat protein